MESRCITEQMEMTDRSDISHRTSTRILVGAGGITEQTFDVPLQELPRHKGSSYKPGKSRAKVEANNPFCNSVLTRSGDDDEIQELLATKE